MRKHNYLKVTAFSLAQRFIGQREIAGRFDNPFIMMALKLDDPWPEHDEVPWCGSFMEVIAWMLRLPRTKTKLARNWLKVGIPVELTQLQVGFDVVILSRPPNPEAGHVGLYAGEVRDSLSGVTAGVLLLSGNQNNEVCIAQYEWDRILGARCIYPYPYP